MISKGKFGLEAISPGLETQRGGFGGSFGGALPAKFIRTTSVQPATLSPVWHERFRL